MSDGLYTLDDFKAGVSVPYWDGEYADELMARFFDLRVAA